MRARENSEQIALLHGEPAERERLSSGSAAWSATGSQIMTRTKKLTAFTASYSQASVIFPYILVAPAYFAHKIQLGGMMQTASAFDSVQEALSFFVTVYRTLAEWQAVVARLDGFEAAIDAPRRWRPRPDLTQCRRRRPRRRSTSTSCHVDLPDGTPLVSADGIRIAQPTSAR